MKRLFVAALFFVAVAFGSVAFGSSTVTGSPATVEAAEAGAACVDGYEYIAHYFRTPYYDEYGDFSHWEYHFWYWEVRRCSMWF